MCWQSIKFASTLSGHDFGAARRPHQAAGDSARRVTSRAQDTKRLRQPAGALPYKVETRRLLERGLDAREGRVQLRAEARYDRDDCDGDAGGDEAVLDGGRAGVVL